MDRLRPAPDNAAGLHAFPVIQTGLSLHGRPDRSYHPPSRPRRLARSRTSPFHGENMGSNPIGVIASFFTSFHSAPETATSSCFAGVPAFASWSVAAPWRASVAGSVADLSSPVAFAQWASRRCKQCLAAVIGECHSQPATTWFGYLSTQSVAHDARPDRWGQVGPRRGHLRQPGIDRGFGDLGVWGCETRWTTLL